MDVSESGRIVEAHRGPSRILITHGLGHTRILRDPQALSEIARLVNSPRSSPDPAPSQAGRQPSPELAGSTASGTSVSAIPLGTWASDAGTFEAYRATVSPQRQRSAAHHTGVEETVTVIRGRVRAGAEGDKRDLGPGDSIRYRDDLPHTFAAVGGDAEVVLLMHYPRPPPTERHAP